MIVRLLFIALLFVTLGSEVSFAHLIPTLVVEAEFHPERHYTLRVNLDPRLFLAREPTTLPPVPPSWYLSQDAIARAETAEQAKAFVGRNLIFKVGDTVLKPEWTISPIDSVSMFPLSPNSAETHLLAEFEGVLPMVDGDFVLTRTKDCPIGLVLTTMHDGDPERTPQALFEGESSRGIHLEAPKGGAKTPPGSPGALAQTASPISPTPTPALWARLSRAWAEYVPVALVLGALALVRWSMAVLGWLIFNTLHLAVWAGEQAGFLPLAPSWLAALYWIALGCAVLQILFIRRWGPAIGVSFAAAGLCHALAHPIGAAALWPASGLLALHAALGGVILAAIGFTLWPKPKAADKPLPGAG